MIPRKYLFSPPEIPVSEDCSCWTKINDQFSDSTYAYHGYQEAEPDIINGLQEYLSVVLLYHTLPYCKQTRLRSTALLVLVCFLHQISDKLKHEYISYNF